MNKSIVKNWKKVIITIVAMTLALFALLFFRKIEEMDSIDIFETGVNLFICLVTLVLYRGFVLTSSFINENMNPYMGFIMSNFMCAVCWCILWIFNGYASLITVRNILYFLVYCFSCISAICLFLYAKTLLDNHWKMSDQNTYAKALKGMKFFNKFYFIMFAVLIAFLLSGDVYSINEQGYYIKGSLSFIPVLINLILTGVFCFLTRNVSDFIGFKIAIYPYAFINILSIMWLIVSPSYEMTTMYVSFSEMFMFTYSYSEMKKYNQSLNTTFSTYISDAEAEKALKGSAEVHIGGDKKYVSVIMCEIRDFNLMVKLLSEKHIADTFNHFLTTMTEIINKHDGLVLGFPGYGILAVFGTQNSSDEHAKKAVDAAIEMQSIMVEINKWNEKNNCPAIHVGIGVSTGDAIIGNIGSENHMRYSAISRIVNLCSRIETYANDDEILITSDTKNAYGDSLITGDEEEVWMKGFTDSILFYSVKGRRESHE